ncbi:MAG: DUF1499 domain-containing protein [Elusimicrobia bacterium]|nr:DUF1499 domain-containing protein [Elusimicrobiota bacterium]
MSKTCCGRPPLCRILGCLSLLAALLAAAAVAAAGPLTRFGVLGFRDAFSLMRGGAWAGLGSAVFAAGVLLAGRWTNAAVAAMAVGALAFAVPWELYAAARSHPPIHDVSTDTQDPPAFSAVLPLRQGAMNPADYGGPAVAAQQKAAYPDLAPLTTPLPAPTVFLACMQAVHALGWKVDGGDAAAGRIEATDATSWFGFKDDVVVRVAEKGGLTVVDVRSVSRVGVGDAGTNARRIRDFLSAVSARLPAE